MARNLVEGDGFAINKGEPLAVSTSPAWTLLLALFYAVLRDPVAAGLSLSYVCAILAAWLAYLLARRITRSSSAGLVAAAVMILNALSIWGLASGMEIPAVVLAGMLVLYCHNGEPDTRKRMFGLPAALAFAALTRPEYFVLIPLALGDTARQLWFEKGAEGRRLVWRVLGAQCLVLGATLAPYFIFNIATSGNLFPTTFYAKAMYRKVGITSAMDRGTLGAFLGVSGRLIHDQFNEIFSLFIKLLGPVFLLFPLGLLMFCRPFNPDARKIGWLLPMALIFMPIAMAVVAPTRSFPNTGNRYFALYVPLFSSAVALGWFVLLKKAGQRFLPIVLLTAFLLVHSFSTLPRTVKMVVRDVDTNIKLYVNMGEWISENIEPDALMAVNDIGGVAYFSGGRRIVDIMGLASPEIWPVLKERKNTKDVRGLKRFLRQQKVDYLVTSPRYYPRLVKDTETFAEVARFKVDYKIGHLWSPQIIYRCQWN